MCEQESVEYYDRLTYVVSDGSPRTVEHWAKIRLFESHSAHVQMAHVNALTPARPVEAWRAVFCNYVLDVLPSTVWRRRGEQLEELQVATHWPSPASTMSARPRLPELRERVAQGEISPELLACWLSVGWLVRERG